MFGQKARKITELSSDVESFRGLYKKELAAKDGLQAFIRDIRVAVGAKENENLFDAIAQFKWDIQHLQGEVELLKSSNASLQERLNAAVAANLASNKPEPQKRKRVAKTKKG